MDLGRSLRRLRQKAGLTQQDIADKLDVSRVAVGQWESDKTMPRKASLEALAKLFNVTVSDLLGEAADGVEMLGSPTGLVPLVGTTHMGAREDDEAPDLSVRVPQEIIDRHPGCFAVRAQGGCMDKRYPHDCVIVLDPGMEPRVGDAVLARFADGRSVLRRYMPGSTVLMLSPDSWSGEWDDIVVAADDDPVELGGVAVWYMAEKDVER